VRCFINHDAFTLFAGFRFGLSVSCLHVDLTVCVAVVDFYSWISDLIEDQWSLFSSW